MFAGVAQHLAALWVVNQAGFTCRILFKELYEKGRTVVYWEYFKKNAAINKIICYKVLLMYITIEEERSRKEILYVARFFVSIGSFSLRLL